MGQALLKWLLLLSALGLALMGLLSGQAGAIAGAGAILGAAAALFARGRDAALSPFERLLAFALPMASVAAALPFLTGQGTWGACLPDQANVTGLWLWLAALTASAAVMVAVARGPACRGRLRPVRGAIWLWLGTTLPVAAMAGLVIHDGACGPAAGRGLGLCLAAGALILTYTGWAAATDWGARR